MTDSFVPDEFTEGDQQYYYRDGRWSDEVGMCVSITRSQKMTMKFFEKNGRMPAVQPKPKARRANSRAAKAKADALRKAIDKASAAKTKAATDS